MAQDNGRDKKPSKAWEWLQDKVFRPLEDKKMPVMEHLVELQARLTRAVLVTGVVFVAENGRFRKSA